MLGGGGIQSDFYVCYQDKLSHYDCSLSLSSFKQNNYFLHKSPSVMIYVESLSAQSICQPFLEIYIIRLADRCHNHHIKFNCFRLLYICACFGKVQGEKKAGKCWFNCWDIQKENCFRRITVRNSLETCYHFGTHKHWWNYWTRVPKMRTAPTGPRFI